MKLKIDAKALRDMLSLVKGDGRGEVFTWVLLRAYDRTLSAYAVRGKPLTGAYLIWSSVETYDVIEEGVYAVYRDKICGVLKKLRGEICIEAYGQGLCVLQDSTRFQLRTLDVTCFPDIPKDFDAEAEYYIDGEAMQEVCEGTKTSEHDCSKFVFACTDKLVHIDGTSCKFASDAVSIRGKKDGYAVIPLDAAKLFPSDVVVKTTAGGKCRASDGGITVSYTVGDTYEVLSRLDVLMSLVMDTIVSIPAESLADLIKCTKAFRKSGDAFKLRFFAGICTAMRYDVPRKSTAGASPSCELDFRCECRGDEPEIFINLNDFKPYAETGCTLSFSRKEAEDTEGYPLIAVGASGKRVKLVTCPPKDEAWHKEVSYIPMAS
jgi:hypothetical protein